MIADFGEWTPDLPALLNQNSFVIKNCVSLGQGYGPLEGPNTSPGIPTTALTARCQGAVSTKNNAQSSFNFAGDATKLYSLSGGTWNDVSKVGGYTTQATDRWYFAQWGQVTTTDQKIFATNFTDPVQSLTLGGATFADLITSTIATRPKARFLAIIKGFLVLANTNDPTDGNQPTRIRWSAFEDPTNFDVAPSTQSDYQNLDGLPGPIRQIVGGEYGAIIQERSIWRMTYVGSPVVFQFDQVDKKNGTQASSSVIPFGVNIAFLGTDGFYIFDGAQCYNISDNQINLFFFNDLDPTYFDRVIGVPVPGQQLLIWTYPSHASNGVANRMVIYNYATNATKRWTQCDLIDSSHIFNFLTADKLVINYTTQAITQNVEINDPQFKGGIRQLAIFDTDKKMYPLNGDALTATFETLDYQLTPERTTDISLIRPLITGAPNLTLYLGQRDSLTDSVSYTSYNTNDSNEFPVRSSARYHRFKLEAANGFIQAQGVDIVDMQPGGKR
jgi:hypothetical protein